MVVPDAGCALVCRRTQAFGGGSGVKVFWNGCVCLCFQLFGGGVAGRVLIKIFFNKANTDYQRISALVKLVC